MSDIKSGDYVEVVDGPHKGQCGRVSELFGWTLGEPRCFIQTQYGYIQTRLSWVKKAT